MDILITFLLLLPTVYLLYVKFSKTKLKAVKKKHPVGSPHFEAYRVLYSTRTLVTFSFLSSLFVIGLVVNLYKSTHTQGSIGAALLILGSMLIPFGLFIWWSAMNKKK